MEAKVNPHLETILRYAFGNMKTSVGAFKFAAKIMTLLFGDYEVDCPS
jgi:hypothetical protein